MSDDRHEAPTRVVRIIRHKSARKVLSANDWRARTEAEAIKARLDELRASVRADVEREVREELADVFVQAAELAKRNLDAQSEAVVDAASRCASRLVEGELDAEPKKIRDIVASVVEQAQADGPVSITVHPSMREQLSDVSAVAVNADASLGVADCIVEVRTGRFDGRLQTRVERLVSFLKAQSLGPQGRSSRD